MTIYCLNCNAEITSKYAKKFCSQSCSASYNNRGLKRNFKKERKKCVICNTEIKKGAKAYCSQKCSIQARTIHHTEHEKRMANRAYFMTYYCRKKNQTPSDANIDLITEIYKQCPEGYEVDHIKPLSKGGLHHHDNLQYLEVIENRKKGAKLEYSLGIIPAPLVEWRSRKDSNPQPSE